MLLLILCRLREKGELFVKDKVVRGWAKTRTTNDNKRERDKCGNINRNIILKLMKRN